ncbi:MAG TPA: hypothetical protein PKA88_04475 [Polyangiaceae bacterium]|nr:hypothetical protein [Polyangiaceae bacterium]
MTQEPPIFIGDALTGSGYRLAGARVLSPSLAQLPAVFQEACRESRLVLITAELAKHLPRGAQAQTQRTLNCSVLVVDSMASEAAAPDLGAAVQRQLGMVS